MKVKKFRNALRQGGWHFQHPQAHLLLDSAPPGLFGPNVEFTIAEYTGPIRATVFAPKNVTNTDILDTVIGAYRVKRWKGNSKGMHVYFSTREALAKAIRDGATIRDILIDFQAANRSPCGTCLSYEHASCAGPLRCSKCLSVAHSRSECKEEQAHCSFCEGSHETRRCRNIKQQLQLWRDQDTAELLQLVTPFEEIRDGAEDVPLATLPPRQIALCKRSGVEPADFASRSFADIVGGRKKKK